MRREITMFSFRTSDAVIVQRTLGGRPQAFEDLVFRYQVKAYAVARALGLKPPETDDAVQEAFLQAFRDLPALREPASFGAWFLNIVRHVSIKEARRASKGGAAAPVGNPAAAAPAPAAGGPPVPSAAEEVEQKDFREYLWRKVAGLPQGTREAIFLFYYQGESVRAVARALGLSVSGTKRRLRSGREELREKLWRSLEQHLRETRPTGRQWRAAGRRLGLLVLSSIPAWFTARVGAMTPGAGADPIEALSRRVASTLRNMKRPVFLTAAKKAGVLAALALLLLYLGREAWVASRPGEEPQAAVASRAAAVGRPATGAVRPAPEADSPRSAAARVEAPPAGAERPEAGAEAPAEDRYDRANRGAVLVRVIWGDDRTPAAGISGLIVPWGSPELYVDERVFTSGPDGTVVVDHVYKGGASIWLDRGGPETKVRVDPGTERETVVEVPPGFNVQGVVVDQRALPVAGARVWLSRTGHMNSGSEVTATSPDGRFFVRAITESKYIAARDRGQAASDLRQLAGEPGATVEVRLVLNGPGGEIRGLVLDELGEPVFNAKVMAGAEYPVYTLLDDGATGFSAPPFVGYTGEDGAFHADSLLPGKTRVAVRAPGFIPLAQEVEVPRSGAVAVELTLRRGATLSGIVTGPGGQWLPGCQVVIGDFRDFLSIKVFSGHEGVYRLRGLPPGDLEAFCQRPNIGKAAKKITVKGTETLRWDPVLAQDLEIHGRVLDDESGAPLEGFVLVIESAVGQVARRASQKRLEADAAGRFELGELSDLPYRLVLFEPKSHFACAVLEDVRPSAEEVEVRVARESLSSAWLTGRVFDAGGNPAPEAKVICYSALGGYRVYFPRKEDGAFRLGPLPRGRYRLEIQARNCPSLAAGEHEVGYDEERDLGVNYLKPPLR